MTIQQLFIRSNQELKKVIDKIGDDQWDLVLPAGTAFKTATLREAVNYHAYDDAWVPDVLAGKTAEEVGNIYDSLRTSSDTKANYTLQNTRASNAVTHFADLDRVVHLSYGDFKAQEYLQHITTYRGFRVHDIAKLIGADTTMPADLVQGLWDEFSPLIEGYRAMGVFPAALKVSADADLQTKLLAMVGRQ